MSLRMFPQFAEFVREQAEQDFEPSRRSDVGDDAWFQALLPRERFLDSLSRGVSLPHGHRGYGGQSGQNGQSSQSGQRKGAAPMAAAGNERNGHRVTSVLHRRSRPDG
jgi:hypothetical protein